MQTAHHLVCFSCSTLRCTRPSLCQEAGSGLGTEPACGNSPQPQASALHRFKKDQSRGHLVFGRAALKTCKPQHQELERCSLVTTASYELFQPGRQCFLPSSTREVTSGLSSDLVYSMKMHQYVTQSHNSRDFHSVTNALECQAPALHMLTFQHNNPTQRDGLTTRKDPGKRLLCVWIEFAPETQQPPESAAGSGTMLSRKSSKLSCTAYTLDQ